MWTEALDKFKKEAMLSDKTYDRITLFLINTDLDDKQKCEVVKMMRDCFLHGQIL
jgi:hypothetical protein